MQRRRRPDHGRRLKPFSKDMRQKRRFDFELAGIGPNRQHARESAFFRHSHRSWPVYYLRPLPFRHRFRGRLTER